ncbi:hypothetical protein [Tepidimonas charontis]|uniref:Uncharacterized protein n=1 Tax=Tepidimonas charontis TaxID=2267262 RepID=A0A554XKZ9_9BURK|nr:hypothetical protein [Tepidimonas charontis]TSE36502.1 hypothetical protein Tchar_00126 [Tepidimonas charontis]
MSPTGRVPPAVVPTLTDVVQAGPEPSTVATPSRAPASSATAHASGAQAASSGSGADTTAQPAAVWSGRHTVGPAASSPRVVSASAGVDDPSDGSVPPDRVEQVLDALLTTLEPRVAAVLDAWWLRQRAALAADLSDTLRDALARDIQAVLAHNGADAPTRDPPRVP